MYFIIGLGNPGTPYTHTRHNVGFLFVDFLAAKAGASFTAHKKLKAESAEITLAGEKVILIKPSVFMNCSGESVTALLQFYKATPQDILVAHDDLDIASGEYRLAHGRSAAGHNGVQNIIDLLKTKDFTRLRLGIGRPLETLGVCMRPHDYVLSTLSDAEELSFQTLFPLLVPELEKIILKNRS